MMIIYNPNISCAENRARIWPLDGAASEACLKLKKIQGGPYIYRRQAFTTSEFLRR